MPPRLPVDPDELAAGALTLDGPRLHYVCRVLRLGGGDELELFDGAGRRARARLEGVSRRQARLTVEAPEPARPVEAATRLELLFGVPRGDGGDRIVRAGTELGVAAFSPVLVARSVARPPAKRRERWARIAREAARQCGRATVPAVADPRPLADALAALPDEASLRLVAWEEERSGTVGAGVGGPRAAAALLGGPVGGVPADEVDAAATAGFAPVTLGPRVLRAPTAAVVASALVLHRLGDLG